MVISYISGSTVTFEEESVALICNVTNDDHSISEITWHHDDKLIVDNDRLTIRITTDNVTGQVQSVLHFDPVYHTDKGEYTCRALNHLECVAEKTTNLTVECKLFYSYL